MLPSPFRLRHRAAIAQGPAGQEIFLQHVGAADSGPGQLSARRARVSIGLGKSLLVQFPFELKDVLVSDPDKVDAVVQASNRVFLIAKKLGQTNAFFFDTKGQQILTLEIAVGADLKSLDDMLKRFVPGSNITAEMAGKAAVLTAPCARRSTPSAPPISPASSWPPTSRSQRPWRVAGGANSTNVSVNNTGSPSRAQIRGQDPAAGRGLRQQTASWSSICSPSRARSR